MSPISRVSGAVVQPFPSCCHIPGDSKPRGPRLCSQGLLLGSPQCVEAVVHCQTNIQSLHMLLEAPEKATGRLWGLPDSLHLAG